MLLSIIWSHTQVYLFPYFFAFWYTTNTQHKHTNKTEKNMNHLFEWNVFWMTNLLFSLFFTIKFFFIFLPITTTSTTMTITKIFKSRKKISFRLPRKKAFILMRIFNNNKKKLNSVYWFHQIYMIMTEWIVKEWWERKIVRVNKIQIFKKLLLRHINMEI